MAVSHLSVPRGQICRVDRKGLDRMARELRRPCHVMADLDVWHSISIMMTKPNDGVGGGGFKPFPPFLNRGLPVQNV